MSNTCIAGKILGQDENESQVLAMWLDKLGCEDTEENRDAILMGIDMAHDLGNSYDDMLAWGADEIEQWALTE